ncbi:hypothetical protein AGMMS49992_28340 [Clostridia bacterium]|nr:hypothetical protein AGMMS49992_28340 [Clostridia bacterium]
MVNSNKDTISVVIPIYLTAAYLFDCLDSVSMQTHQNLNIICVDDGTPDQASEAALSRAVVDERVYVISKLNKGLSDSRNTGNALLTGDWVTYIDSDDWIDSDMIAAMYEEALRFNADSVMCSYVKEYNTRSIVEHVFPCSFSMMREQFRQTIYRRFFGPLGEETRAPHQLDLLVTNCMQLFRREIINNIMFMDTKLIGTEDLLFQAMVYQRCNSFSYIDRPLYHYRKTNQRSLTTVYKRDLDKKWANMFVELAKLIDQYQLGCNFLSALQNREALSVLTLSMNTESSSMSISEKAHEILGILNSTPYCFALYSLDTSFMPLHWKTFYQAAKRKHKGICLLIVSIINQIRKFQ